MRWPKAPSLAYSRGAGVQVSLRTSGVTLHELFLDGRMRAGYNVLYLQQLGPEPIGKECESVCATSCPALMS